MTTKIIDIALHAAAFPATYTGPGTLIGNPKAAALAKGLSLNWTSEGSDVVIPLGDEPLKIEIWNETDVIKWEWARGLAGVFKTLPGSTGANDTVTTADDTSGYITFSGDALNGNLTATISASLLGTSKVIAVHITG